MNTNLPAVAWTAHSGVPVPPYYAILGVVPTATAGEIRRAYYKRAAQCHPDSNVKSPGAAGEFERLAEAYATLSDTALRRAYDVQHGVNRGGRAAELRGRIDASTPSTPLPTAVRGEPPVPSDVVSPVADTVTQTTADPAPTASSPAAPDVVDAADDDDDYVPAPAPTRRVPAPEHNG
jgi:curved DNA-binding protein CbpA